MHAWVYFGDYNATCELDMTTFQSKVPPSDYLSLNTLPYLILP